MLAKLYKITNQDGTHELLMFWCEGCQTYHGFDSRWTFNGDYNEPTFSPSLLVKWDFKEGINTKVCHSFVRDGKIEYLSDCTHQYAGQTLELKDIDTEV